MSAESDQKQSWLIQAVPCALRTSNPIREIVDTMDLPKDPERNVIPLSIGDPTVFKNLSPPESVNNAVQETLLSGSFNGYPPAIGNHDARKAIASRFSMPPHGDRKFELSPSDVIITSGCSGALDLCFRVLADAGDNILLPCPGFSLYRTLCDHLGVEKRFYNLRPDSGWDCDLQHMESLINNKTRAILVNNPSNPCGSVFSRDHLLAILEIANRHKLPIIADEIYETMTFTDDPFHPIATLSSEVPILTVGGLAKQFLVPGWRVGWILIHDRQNRFQSVREGLRRLATLILGANSLIQASIPAIFENTPDSYYRKLNSTLEAQASAFVRGLIGVNGLKCVVPRGAMYIMVQIVFEEFSDIDTDVKFSQKLLDEEAVFVLPGSCFGAPSFFRVVICPPLEKLDEACDRIKRFCERHKNSS